MKFTATISRIEDAEIHWTSIIIIPDTIFSEMINMKARKRHIMKAAIRGNFLIIKMVMKKENKSLGMIAVE